MIYRESADNRFKEHLEEVRVRRAGRGLMPYRAPLPPPSGTPIAQEGDPHLGGSFPPLELSRGAFALVSLLAAFVGLSALSWLHAVSSERFSMMIVITASILGWIFYNTRRGRRLARGEAAWLKGLPFEVGGYLASLCSDPLPRDEYNVRLTVTMLDEALPEWAFASLSELLPRPMTVSALGPLRFSIKLKALTKGAQPMADPTNLQLRDCLHECVTRLLLPLHTTYRVQRAEFFVS